jgi:hypothetical protein
LEGFLIKMISVYAPASDGNNPEAYTKSLMTLINGPIAEVREEMGWPSSEEFAKLNNIEPDGLLPVGSEITGEMKLIQTGEQCYDDKSAMSRFVSYLPDEKAIMANLCGEQEHVTFGYHSNIGSDREFAIVLFRDGHAYYYEQPTIGIQSNAYNCVGDLEYRLNQEKEDTLVNNIANSVHNINTFKSMYAIKPPIEQRTSILGFRPGFYIDYSVFTRKSYPVLYHTPDSKKSSYKNSGLCSYCGGTFEGTFIKKCMICGKKKDY